MTKYRIKPKRDFGPKGFWIKGEWVKKGFVVTDGFCNVMPGAIWFSTIESAMNSLADLIASNGDSQKFWELTFARRDE